MLENVLSLAGQTTQAAQSTGTWIEDLGLGGGVMALGLVVVFLGLISLIIITLVYPKIAKALISKSTSRKEKAAAKKVAKAESKKKVSAPVAAQKTAVPAASAKPENDDALIAVITAAVAASLGTSSNGVVIKSIERTGQNAPAWGARGRIEQVYNRF